MQIGRIYTETESQAWRNSRRKRKEKGNREKTDQETRTRIQTGQLGGLSSRTRQCTSHLTTPMVKPPPPPESHLPQPLSTSTPAPRGPTVNSLSPPPLHQDAVTSGDMWGPRIIQCAAVTRVTWSVTISSDTRMTAAGHQLPINSPPQLSLLQRVLRCLRGGQGVASGQGRRGRVLPPEG
jgi:hypothetical protein